jgi:hypothetical protein
MRIGPGPQPARRLAARRATITRGDFDMRPW